MITFDHTQDTFNKTLGVSADREKELYEKIAGVIKEMRTTFSNREIWGLKFGLLVEKAIEQCTNENERAYVLIQLGVNLGMETIPGGKEMLARHKAVISVLETIFKRSPNG